LGGVTSADGGGRFVVDVLFCDVFFSAESFELAVLAMQLHVPKCIPKIVSVA
jgi:hypothetical protein